MRPGIRGKRQQVISSSLSVRTDRKLRLARLKRRIDKIARGHTSAQRPASDGRFATGLFHAEREAHAQKAIDPFLAGGGAAPPALHELIADSYLDQPAVRDFALTLIASLIHRQANSQMLGHGHMVLWCQRQLDIAEFGRLYGPGLRALGLPPERFLMVTAKRDADCLWAMEQGLASRSLLAVIGQVGHADLIASRRLSLAASAHGAFCFLLPVHTGQDPSAARMRWRIRAALSASAPLDPLGPGKPSWRLDLERSPNGRTGHWTVEWDHATHHFHLAPELGDRPAARRCIPDQPIPDVIAFEQAG